MSNASSPNSVNQLKNLGLASSIKAKKLSPLSGSISEAPRMHDSVEISAGAKEIGGVEGPELDQMTPQELLDLAKKLFEKFDLNGDGKVSRREANKLGVSEETFNRYDDDGNGSLDMNGEFAPNFLRDLHTSGDISMSQYLGALKEVGGVGQVMKGFVELFDRVDANGDGNVSAEEASQFGVDADKFNSWDADGDGKVNFLNEYLPKVCDELHDQGVLSGEEYDKLMARIENAANEQNAPQPPVQVDPQALTSVGVQGEPTIGVGPIDLPERPERADRPERRERAERPERRERAERPERPERREDQMRVREHVERWMRAHSIDPQRLEDLTRRMLNA